MKYNLIIERQLYREINRNNSIFNKPSNPDDLVYYETVCQDLQLFSAHFPNDVFL